MRWLPSSNETNSASALEVGTLSGAKIVSLPVGVSRLCTIVSDAPVGSGRSRYSGSEAEATACPHTFQLTEMDDVMHSLTAPTATATCQKDSLAVGAVKETPSALLPSTAISSSCTTGL